MSAYSETTVWLIIAALGCGTYLVRLSFLGILGNRDLPECVLRHLRYTPVAILPALITPLVLWPQATGGALDAPRLSAAIVALSVGIWRKNAIAAVFAGMATLYGVGYFLG